MESLNCRICGTELLPATSFCRQCGSAISVDLAAESSEQPTALFNETNGTTQRLDPRPTRPERVGMNMPLTDLMASDMAPQQNWKGRRVFIVGALLVVLIVAVISVVAILRVPTDSRTSVSTTLVYPGARTILDVTNQNGGRALQLETSDSFKKVEDWYQATLKPQKTVRLTSNSVVLKNENTTATIAVEGDKTNVLIKQAN